MNKAIIFHGTSGDSQSNWIPWLKKQLESRGWQVWAPNLPHADRPNLENYLKFIDENLPFAVDDHTTLIGHSSGAAAGLGFLQTLPEKVQINRAILVSAFHTDLGWDKLSDLFKVPLDYELIKTKAREFIFIHADNDPYVDITEAEFLVGKLEGDLRLLKGQGHFNLSASPMYKEFQKLLAMVLKQNAQRKIKLYLVRHGETDYNRDGLVQGWVNSTLTEKGNTQAEEVAQKLAAQKIELVFTSDLGRAYQTGKIISQKLAIPLVQNWLLRERSLGKLERTLICEVDWEKYNHHCVELIEKQIESVESMQSRAQLFLESLALMPIEFQTAVVVTHGGMLTAFKKCFDPQTEFEEFPNTAIVEIDWEF